MNTHKITNITNTVGKRDPKFNRPVNIDYVSSMQKHTIVVKPGESIYLTIPQLPLTVQKLRMGGYIIIDDIAENQLASIMKPVIAEKILSVEQQSAIPNTDHTTTLPKKRIKPSEISKDQE